MENFCSFFPDRCYSGVDGVDDGCGNIATRRVWLKPLASETEGYYVWICEDCIAEAVAWWNSTDVGFEF